MTHLLISPDPEDWFAWSKVSWNWGNVLTLMKVVLSHWLNDSVTQRVKMTHLLISPDPVNWFAWFKVSGSHLLTLIKSVSERMTQGLNESKSQSDSFAHSFGFSWPICMIQSFIESGQCTFTTERCFRGYNTVIQWFKESKWLICSYVTPDLVDQYAWY